MSWLQAAGSAMSSGSSGGSIWGSVFQAVLGGLGSSSEAKLSMKMMEEGGKLKGYEDRKTLDFTAQLEDYYKQEDKVRKRAALDTYGQFSLLKKYAPNMKQATPLSSFTKPTPTQ